MRCGWLALVVACSYPALPRLDDGGGGDDGGGDGSRPSQYASCMNLAPDCGVNESCCAPAIVLPEGTYWRSYDTADNLYTNMNYPASVSPFVLDKFEVSVGRFRQFVTSGKGTQADPPSAGAGGRLLNGALDKGGWDSMWNTSLVAGETALRAALQSSPCGVPTWTDAAGANETKPINCVTWYEAMAFCIWDGGYLPTEAEWNYAAAGGNEQRPYPWSTSADPLAIGCTYANYMNSTGTWCLKDAAHVGSTSTGNGLWGHADLAGNVSEWTLDYYESSYPVMACDNCATLTSTTGMRAWRGGGYLDPATGVRVGRRVGNDPRNRGFDLGFRCARPY